MSDQNLPNLFLGNINSNAADIAAGMGSEGGDTDGSQSDNASVVGSQFCEQPL